MKNAILTFIALSGIAWSGLSQSYTNLKLIYKGNGLDATNVRKIIEDNFGFKWMATQDGLYRFDGHNFRGYHKSMPAKFALTGVDVRDIGIVKSNLWVINSYGGFDAIDLVSGSVIFRFNQRKDSTLKNVLFVTLAVFENKIFLGSNSGIYILNTDTKELVQYLGIRKLTNDILNVNKLVIDKQDRLWAFCGSQGIMILSAKTLQPICYYQVESNLTFNDCAASGNEIFSATSSGPKHFIVVDQKIEEKTSFSFLPKSVKTFPTFAVSVDSKGLVWMSNKNHLFAIDVNARKSSIVSPHKLNSGKNWTSSVFQIFFDRENNIWLSCQQGIAFGPNKPSEFLCINKSYTSSVQIDHSYYLWPCSDSMTFVCAEDGLYKVNINTKSIEIIDLQKSYFFIFEDNQKQILVSNDEGTFILRNERLLPISTIYPEFRKYTPLIINSKIQLGDSVLIFGSQNYKGLFIWNRKRKTVVNIFPYLENGLRDDDINSIYRDTLSNLILILTANSLYKLDYREKRLREVPILDKSLNEKVNILYDIVRIGSEYYLATYGSGIVVLDSGLDFVRKVTVRDGLTNDCVYKLLPFGDTLLFATTNNGLSILNLKHFGLKRFFAEDGIHSNNFEELSGIVRNNMVYIGGIDGFTILNPKLVVENTVAPRVAIDAVQLETTQKTIDTLGVNLAKVFVPNSIKQVKIFFSVFNFMNPSRATVKYRINEIGSGWLSSTNQTHLELIGLKPGIYHLNLCAYNESGVPSEIKELVLVYEPKWFQTWIFKVLIFAAFLSLIYSFFLVRIAQIKREQTIKSRIANDLHDDLGGTINSVKIYATLAKIEKHNEKYLTRIEESAKDAINAVKDMLWVLDERKETIGDLITRVSQFADPICDANKMSYKVRMTVEAKAFRLGAQEKRNLFMMIKEIVNNSVKYSKASEISIVVIDKKKKPEFSISDNGIGFLLSEIKRGNGLNNISKRAKEIKYEVQIQSKKHNGVTIVLKKP